MIQLCVLLSLSRPFHHVDQQTATCSTNRRETFLRLNANETPPSKYNSRFTFQVYQFVQHDRRSVCLLFHTTRYIALCISHDLARSSIHVHRSTGYCFDATILCGLPEIHCSPFDFVAMEQFLDIDQASAKCFVVEKLCAHQPSAVLWQRTTLHCVVFSPKLCRINR